MSEYQPNAVLSFRQDINHELSIFRISPDSGDKLSFLPGQYAELAIPDGDEGPGKKLLRRSYSIASAPSNPAYLEFYIVRVDGGAFTPKLFSLAVGDRLWLGPKIKGKFTLEEIPQGSDVVMVATGTGLAPFLSMVREHKENPPWRRAVLIHGARYQHDLGYKEELLVLQNQYHWFSYLTTLTREPADSGWLGNRGRVQSLFTTLTAAEIDACVLAGESILSDSLLASALGQAPAVQSTHFLLCGNPQMIDDLEMLLGKASFKAHKKREPGNLHIERYW